jgi:hypothetical protein
MSRPRAHGYCSRTAVFQRVCELDLEGIVAQHKFGRMLQNARAAPGSRFLYQIALRPFESSGSGCQVLHLPAPVEIDAVSAVGFEDSYHLGPSLFVRHINGEKEVATTKFLLVIT